MLSIVFLTESSCLRFTVTENSGTGAALRDPAV